MERIQVAKWNIKMAGSPTLSEPVQLFPPVGIAMAAAATAGRRGLEIMREV